MSDQALPSDENAATGNTRSGCCEDRLKGLRSWSAIAVIVVLWFCLVLSYFGAKAINNYPRIHEFESTDLPVFVGWLISASRYHIITGLAGALTVAGIWLLRKNANEQALILFMVGSTAILGFIVMAMASFSLHVGVCLCDGWTHWEISDVVKPSDEPVSSNPPGAQTE